MNEWIIFDFNYFFYENDTIVRISKFQMQGQQRKISDLWVEIDKKNTKIIVRFIWKKWKKTEIVWHMMIDNNKQRNEMKENEIQKSNIVTGKKTFLFI